MNETPDPLLEAALAESLGGMTPRDLTARILRTARLRHGPAMSDSLALDGAALPVEAPVVPATGWILVAPPSNAPRINGHHSVEIVPSQPADSSRPASAAASIANASASANERDRKQEGDRSISRTRWTVWLATTAAAVGIIAWGALQSTPTLPWTRRSNPTTPQISRSTPAHPVETPNRSANAKRFSVPPSGDLPSGDLASGDSSFGDPATPVSPSVVASSVVPPAVVPPAAGDLPQLPSLNQIPLVIAPAPNAESVAPSPDSSASPSWTPPAGVPNAALPFASQVSPHRDPATGDRPQDTWERLPNTARHSDAEVVAFIDAMIAAGWREGGLEPSANASDEEWLRRVFLDVIGRIPTYEESMAFVQEKSPDKKTQWVDRLLGSPYYEVEYARHWTTLWTNLLIGRSAEMDRKRPVHREGMQQWLRRQFVANRPYDQFVRDLVAAAGVNTPDDPEFNGAVNFLLAHSQGDFVAGTNKVSELFLGKRIRCAQCHTHPYNNWSQQDFWELNAFFRQARVRRAMEDDAPRGQSTQLRGAHWARLVNEDFAGEATQNPTPHEAEIYYEQRNGIWRVAYPRFEKQAISRSGYVGVTDRRSELAELMIQSPWFARAAVNRAWGHFLGYGFVNPLEDLGPHNPPSHPELLDGLAADFAAQGFDSKRLIRWIVLSRPYGLSSRVNSGKPGAIPSGETGPSDNPPLLATNERDDPQRVDLSGGERLLFSRFYPRPLQVEQVFDSLATVAHGVPDVTALDAHERQRHLWLQQFVLALENDENHEVSLFAGPSQTLALMNGEVVRQALSAPTGVAGMALTDRKLPNAQRVERIYRVALARKPTPREMIAANKWLTEYRGDTGAWLQDIMWALLNSNEFILNH